MRCFRLVSFVPSQKTSFSKPGSVIFGCVLGYWHALCSGWRPDWGGALWGPWVSNLTITPVLSKGLFTHGPCASLSLLRSDRATSSSSADRYRIHLYGFSYLLSTLVTKRQLNKEVNKENIPFQEDIPLMNTKAHHKWLINECEFH